MTKTRMCKTGLSHVEATAPIFCPVRAKMAVSADKRKLAELLHCKMQHLHFLHTDKGRVHILITIFYGGDVYEQSTHGR